MHFAVCDTGIGVPVEKQQTIFQAFEQADGSATRRYGGTGLGLTISAELVAMMGGRVWVESPNPNGHGSTFHFTARFGLPPEGAVPPPFEPIDIRDLPVLVVDDNHTNCRILDRVLTAWRMKPTTVENGPAALAELRRAAASGDPYPLVLLDAMMPEMDGFMLAEQIKGFKDLAGSTIMMLSSADRQGDAQRCKTLGIQAYLTKPLKQSELLNTILNILSTRPGRIEDRKAKTKDQSSILNPQSSLASSGLRILLAEDNAVNQHLAVRLLGKHGYAVTVAGNGREALRLWREQPFDLILMDVQMPDMGGFEATAAIRDQERSTGRHTPIIALTAHAIKGDRERCLAAGMDGYVSKPIQASELFQVIEEMRQGIKKLESSPSAGPSGKPDVELFDPKVALDATAGDADLLAEVIEVFLAEHPPWMTDIRRAVEAEDADALRLSAHTLKGAVGTFGSQAGYEAALRLETMGRNGDLTDAGTALVHLETVIAKLRPMLESFRTEHRGRP